MKNMTGILLQKSEKNADGTWETVKEDTETDQAEELKGTLVYQIWDIQNKESLKCDIKWNKTIPFYCIFKRISSI